MRFEVATGTAEERHVAPLLLVEHLRTLAQVAEELQIYLSCVKRDSPDTFERLSRQGTAYAVPQFMREAFGDMRRDEGSRE
jgi:hypothetical protein